MPPDWGRTQMRPPGHAADQSVGWVKTQQRHSGGVNNPRATFWSDQTANFK